MHTETGFHFRTLHSVNHSVMAPQMITRTCPADPLLGDEVVISGLSGRFPDSDTVYDLQKNLFDKVDMVTDDDRRWKPDNPVIPQRLGKINDLNRFDSAYFGIHTMQSKAMDPQIRILLEKTYEAVVDAGVNPRHIRGSRTGVFIGACMSETEKRWLYDCTELDGFGLTGCSRAMFSNRISYWLGATGPSYTVDTACSSSLYALEHAYKAIRNGDCDAAIVGGTNLCLHPNISLQFALLGVLSSDGKCKSFDNNGNGYARSETISVVYLQKAKNAKRIYASVVHAKTNCDGYKKEGITYPSGNMQIQLLKEFYAECGLSPTSLNFLEAHATGTSVGDPEELMAIEEVFCSGRSTPLLLGSVKSNLGHSEAASGMCSIAKVIVGMETGLLPPNLHYKTPRTGINALANGMLKVVTENTPWNGGLVGVNSFGFGGANCHVLLKSNEKVKVNGGKPLDSLPRLVVASGRTEEAVKAILEDVENRPVDVEFVHLLQDLHSSEIPGHIYRGYTLLMLDEGGKSREVKYYSGEKRPVWFVFSGMGSQWNGMGKSLMNIPVFAGAIEQCHQVLSPKGINIMQIITDDDPMIMDNILNCFVGIAAIQIGLVDVLTAVGITPDGIIGHSVGELGCAYADGTFTAEQMILSAYYRGRASIEAEIIQGSMAAVGRNYQQIKNTLPPEIDVACHNSCDSCTISGPADIVKDFVAELQSKEIFARQVHCANIAYHSRYITKVGSKLIDYLKQIIPEPKTRSSKWVSSSVPEANWSFPEAQLSSPEYHTNNLLQPVLFEEASLHIPSNAIAIEIAPHGLLQAILKRSFPKEVLNVGLTQRGMDSTKTLLTALGKLYEAGLIPQLTKLYPTVQYPVSRGTPMISPLVKWEHSYEWFVMLYKSMEDFTSGERIVHFNFLDEDKRFYLGHVIDGRNLFPAAGYLCLAWESLSILRGNIYTEIDIVFEDVKFTRATHVPKDDLVVFTVMIQKGSGKFEIVEGGAIVASGRVRMPDDVSKELANISFPSSTHHDDWVELNARDIYKNLRLRGYNYSGLFRALVSSNNLGTSGQIRWKKNWITFLDNMLQLKILTVDTRALYIPTSIEKLTIHTKKHVLDLEALSDDKVLPVYVDTKLNIIRSGGVEIRGLSATSIAHRKPLGKPVLERHQFVVHQSTADEELTMNDLLHVSMHLMLENQSRSLATVKVVELLDRETNPKAPLLAPGLASVVIDLPLIQPDITVLTNPENPVVSEVGPHVQVNNRKLAGEQQSCHMVVASNIMRRSEVLQMAVGALVEEGCILAWERTNVDMPVTDLEVILDQRIGGDRLMLLRKGVKNPDMTIIQVTEKNYNWLPALQEALKSAVPHHRIILVAQGEPFSGILGLFNCIRREPGGELARCFFIPDGRAPQFDLKLDLYHKQLTKDLAVNVLQNGQWGSYRHLPLEQLQPLSAPHVFNNVAAHGDLSSLTWFEGPLRPNSMNTTSEHEPVEVYYSALNFRDIMVATGRLSVDIVASSRLQQDCVQGLEFSGHASDGRCVMGMVSAGAIANVVSADRCLLWNVPNDWTLEDAATVPVVYGTVLYALILSGRMKRGESILIHAGSGGVGQAAINIAMHYGLTVFTTVGTQEKREFIKKQFPQLNDSCIGNSRDTSFEQLVLTETNGRGVDLVLNSLSEEKLQASVRCLARGGRFLEIGKFDLANNNPLGMATFLKERSFHGVMLDAVFNADRNTRLNLHRLLDDALQTGAIRPLRRTVFHHDEVEQAFRYMAAGKHMGKVLIQMQLDGPGSKRITHKGMPRVYCSSKHTHIIIGGLGGFGLELADWLVLRGARKLVLVSRTGVRTGYQSKCVHTWLGYGVTVHISTVDISSREGITTLLTEASGMGPVEGIYNLAVVLNDALFENQTKEDFTESMNAKAIATRHLDVLSRRMCPQLRYFVAFSSVSCGRGNAGQTNYGMANSVMERVCETRARDGLPGIAVQWGAVGDVGLVAEMQEDNQELVIGGTLQQRISSCLEVLDGFLRQQHPVVASMVVAEKYSSESDSVVDFVTRILGLHDIKTVSPQTSLVELGMDSMMGVEIKQVLERDFEVFLTPQDIRDMTIARLQELAQNKENGTSKSTEDALYIVQLPSLVQNKESQEGADFTPLFMIPGIEDLAMCLVQLSKHLEFPAFGLQLGPHTGSSIHDFASFLLKKVKEQLHPGGPFAILGYSFGGLLAMEVAAKLEAEGYYGRLLLVDSAPRFLQKMSQQTLNSSIENDFEIFILLHILKLMSQDSPLDFQKIHAQLLELGSWGERRDYLQKFVPEKFLKSWFNNSSSELFRNRVKAVVAFEWMHKSLISPVMLLRSSDNLYNLEDDYGLQQYCKEKVDVHIIDSTHISILNQQITAKFVNKFFANTASGVIPYLKSKSEINGH